MRRALRTHALLLLAMCACRTERAHETPAVAARAVTLPDISAAAPAVQQQIRDEYAAVQKDPQNADAYGALGRLLVAAEFYDAASTSFTDAQTLAPNDMRWPYYQAHVE